MILQSLNCQLPISFLRCLIIPTCMTYCWVYLVDCSISKLSQFSIIRIILITHTIISLDSCWTISFIFPTTLLVDLINPVLSKTSSLPDQQGYPLYSTCCHCLLLKQVIDSHQFRPTDDLQVTIYTIQMQNKVCGMNM